MSRKRLGSVSAAAIILALGATAAIADDADELQELRDRVAALEAEAETSGRPRLSFSVGESTEIQLYGFVRFEAFYDFDFAQGDLSRAGRVGDPAFATDGDFETSVRVSRFGIRSNTDTDIGPIGTVLEFDLFSESDATTSPDLRLRKAFVNINNTFLLGQENSNFIPGVHYPRSADFNGPVGITFARVPQVRYTRSANGLTFSASIEDAGGNDNDPIGTVALLYEFGNDASVRIAGLAGSFEDGGGNDLDTYGVTVSGAFTPWNGGRIGATYTSGEALGNLLIGGGVRSVGGVENDSDSFTVELTQQVSDDWSVGIAYGYEDYDLATPIGGSGNSFDELTSVHVNAFYTPVENLTLAAEYVFIESEGPGGFSADANRIGLSATFRF